MSRYRKVSVHIHADEKYMKLSKPQPNAQSLFLHLLIGPSVGIIPGLYRVGEMALAEELGWELGEKESVSEPFRDGSETVPKSFRNAFRELEKMGLVKADWDAKLVWIPNAIKHNKPHNPNQVKAWKEALDTIPECALKVEAYQILRNRLETISETYPKLFGETVPKPLPEQFPNGTPPINSNSNSIKEQEQELSGEGEKRKKSPSKSKGKKKKKAPLDPDEKKHHLEQAREKAKNRPKSNAVPAPEGSGVSSKKLFRTKGPARRQMLATLQSKTKKQTREKLEKELIDDFQRVYEHRLFQGTGARMFKQGKHIRPACLKLAIICLELNKTPEQMIEYWVEENFTETDFPVLQFMASDVNIERFVVAITSNGKGKERKRKGKRGGALPSNHNHTFKGKLDEGFRDALKEGGFEALLEKSDQELLTYQVATKQEQSDPGGFRMSPEMTRVVKYLNNNFYVHSGN